MKATALWSTVSTRLVAAPPPGPSPSATDPVHLLAFTCSTCPAVHHKSCASDAALTPEERREVLLELEPDAIADGWSIGADHDHCPRCAAALGLPTTRTP